MIEKKPAAELRTTVRAQPHDVVRLHYALPRMMVEATDEGVEIRTCRGGRIAVPQSLLTTPVSISTDGEASSHILLQARVPRDVRRLVGSLAQEIVRLTREVIELEEAARAKVAT
jgi:hypothetical protein